MKAKRFKPTSLGRQFALNYLLVSTIPVLFLFILALVGTRATRDYLADSISDSTHALNRDAEYSLQLLGEKLIQDKARDVAKQIEIYFRMYPERDIQEMREDPVFMDLAIQGVGRTGYTAITEARTYMLRVHPNPKLVDFDMHRLAERIPSWWAIIEKSNEGRPSSGYYDWIEPDGSIRKKYMAMTPVSVPLNGITMIVSATTYIDEFSGPVIAMQAKADDIVARYGHYMTRLWFYFWLIAVAVILLSFGVTYFLGRRVALQFIRPIVQLADTARQYGEGRWDAQRAEAISQRKDEIGILSRSLNDMSGQLKDLFSRLENQLAELKETQKALGGERVSLPQPVRRRSGGSLSQRPGRPYPGCQSHPHQHAGLPREKSFSIRQSRRSVRR